VTGDQVHAFAIQVTKVTPVTNVILITIAWDHYVTRKSCVKTNAHLRGRVIISPENAAAMNIVMVMTVQLSNVPNFMTHIAHIAMKNTVCSVLRDTA
jgi:hypothetical protein